MGPIELAYIKRIQREYRSLFGKDLLIDFYQMKQGHDFCDYKPPIGEVFEQICLKSGTTLAQLRYMKQNKLRCYKNSPEYEALLIIARYVFSNNVNVQLASRIIGIDRSAFYHYAGRKKKEAAARPPVLHGNLDAANS